MDDQVRLRPMERDDLKYVHTLRNDAEIMAYWFREPFESYGELQDLYEKHIHDQSERRFIVEKNELRLGLVELVSIDYRHRRAEFQIIIDPVNQGHGYAKVATQLAMRYAFTVLNMHKLYLVVDKENEKAIHIYGKVGFQIEGELIDEYFVGGRYHDAIRMSMFQRQYLDVHVRPEK